MLKKTSLLLLSIACLTACADENTSDQPKIEEPVNQEVEIVEPDEPAEVEVVETVEETEVEVDETPQTLSESEIRTIMDKFEKMRQLVIDTHMNLTFTEEEFYSPKLQTTR